MDAGGLAQMTYNNHAFAPNAALGMPGVGFASRGKASQLKRLSVAVPPKISSIDENRAEGVSTPRTSRSHLLAGLRTAPKNGAVPASAPYNKQSFSQVQSAPYGAQNVNRGYGQAVPHTSVGSNFPANVQSQYGMNTNQQVYGMPQQVLAPQTVQYGQEDEEVDPNVLAQLMATELYLAQRQQELQRQLLALSTPQVASFGVTSPLSGRQAQFTQSPVTSQTGYYNQQLQNGVAPVTQELPGQPGVYVVYNPLTGQYNYAMDQSAQQQQVQLANSPPPATPSYAATSFQSAMERPHLRNDVSPPIEKSSTPLSARSISPPKKSPSPPADVKPLPPPSANAFRRGHKKGLSNFTINTSATGVADGPKSAFIRPVGMPMTPMTGTFGPGQGRAGEHPTRQPRGPPSLEELVAAPTSKHEGSKNFATRQRRRALHSLVRASNERRQVVRSGSSGSAGSITPISENDGYGFNSGSDTESVHSGSTPLSRKTSEGSLRASVHGAIGGERKQLIGRLSSGSLSGGEPDEMKQLPGQRRTPFLTLTSATEKRMNNLF